MIRARTTIAAVAALAVASVAVGGCSGGDGGGGEPGLDRIDGPAQVDPDVNIGGAGASSEDSDG